MIKVEIDDRASPALAELGQRADDLMPVFRSLGELLVDSTRQRFQAGRAPDGTPWAPNTQATFISFLGRYGGSFSGRTGRITAAGSGRAIGKQPLIGESRRLSSEISYQAGRDFVEVGSGLVYAAMHQFGGTKAQFANLWGDIPARPFLGLSDQDRDQMDAVVRAHLSP